MLVHKEQTVTQHVEFVKYTGKYPNLCSGILTLIIDGKKEVFGNTYKPEKGMHPKFWSPCGGEPLDDPHSKNEWAVDVRLLPEQFRKYAAEIDSVFNENVEYGHCGGCM